MCARVPGNHLTSPTWESLQSRAMPKAKAKVERTLQNLPCMTTEEAHKVESTDSHGRAENQQSASCKQQLQAALKKLFSFLKQMLSESDVC